MLQAAKEGTKGKKCCPGDDCILLLAADTTGSEVWRKAWVQEQLPNILHQEVKHTGTQGKHENRWSNGAGYGVVS